MGGWVAGCRSTAQHSMAQQHHGSPQRAPTAPCLRAASVAAVMGNSISTASTGRGTMPSSSCGDGGGDVMLVGACSARRAAATHSWPAAAVACPAQAVGHFQETQQTHIQHTFAEAGQQAAHLVEPVNIAELVGAGGPQLRHVLLQHLQGWGGRGMAGERRSRVATLAVELMGLTCRGVASSAGVARARSRSHPGWPPAGSSAWSWLLAGSVGIKQGEGAAAAVDGGVGGSGGPAAAWVLATLLRIQNLHASLSRRLHVCGAAPLESAWSERVASEREQRAARETIDGAGETAGLQDRV